MDEAERPQTVGLDNEPQLVSAENSKFRAINIQILLPLPTTAKGWFNRIYGTDIFINAVPILKTLLLVNIIAWIFIIWTM